MWNCKHCKKEFIFNTTSQKANHSRWCIENPNRVSQNLIDSINNRFDKKLGSYKKFNVVCESCENIFEVEEREHKFPSKNNYFCSRKCANSIGGKAKREKYGLISYASIAKEYHEQICIVCGFDELVDVHHIDGNRENNDVKNLVYLCPNHHYLLHRKNSEKVKNIIVEYVKNKWGQ